LTDPIACEPRHEEFTMKLTHTLMALAIASSAAVAPNAFAQSADLSITGKILPGACVIDLGNGGVAELGDIRSTSLDAEKMTELDPVDLTVSVSCDSAVRFALQGVDNTGDSAYTAFRYGLGRTADDEKIGSATIGLKGISIDSANGFATTSYDGGATWSNSVAGNPALIPTDGMVGFAAEQGVTTGPTGIESLQGTLEVKASIAPTSGMTITGDVPINGSATINVMYL